MRSGRIKLPPGPSKSAIDQVSSFNFRPHEFMDECRERYGDNFTLNMTRLPTMVLISDPKLVKIVLDNPKVFRGGTGNRATAVHEGLGEYFLMVLDGPEHHHLQSRLKIIFDGAKDSFMPAVKELLMLRMSEWPRHKEFSLLREMQLLALEVIVMILIGEEREEQRKKIVNHIHEMIDTAVLDDKPNMLSNFIGFFPEREIVYGLFDKEIAYRKRHGRQGRLDVLSRLIEPENGSDLELTHSQLRDQMLSLAVAGYDTTATTLAWVFHYILQSNEAMNSIQDEVREIAALDKITPAALTRRPSLNAIVNETARLHPITPILNRMTSEEVALGDYVIPAGVMVCPSLYLLHTNAVYGDDAMQWRYDRRPNKLAGAFLPFGGGERGCIGQRFARPEINLIVATVLTHFNLDLQVKDSRAMRRGFVVVPESGVPVVARKQLR